MDNNTSDPQSNNKTSFLSSENPDVLKNVDIKTTISSGSVTDSVQSTQPIPQDDSSTGYVSPYSSPYAGNTVQPTNPTTPGLIYSPPTLQEGTEPPAQNFNLGQAQQPQHPAFGQQFNTQNYQLPTENPLQTKQNIIYKSEEKSGGSFLGRLLSQIFSTLGCLLLIVAIFAGIFVYYINF